MLRLFKKSLFFFFLFTCKLTLAQSQWSVYENDHFVAYSDADALQVLPLLQRLEVFHSVILRLSAIEVPLDAKKYRLIILRNEEEYHKVSMLAPTVVTSAMFYEKSAMIITLGPSQALAEESLRHYYAHHMLSFKDISYPNWYEEGFSELLATMNIDLKLHQFTYGERSLRYKDVYEVSYHWGDLLGYYYSPHSSKNKLYENSSYYQSWALVHFLMFSDRAYYGERLQGYLQENQKINRSDTLFREQFDVDAEALWESKIKPYLENYPTFNASIGLSKEQLEFSQIPTNSDDHLYLLNYLTVHSYVQRIERTPKLSGKILSGEWGLIGMNKRCEKRFGFKFDDTRLFIRALNELNGFDFLSGDYAVVKIGPSHYLAKADRRLSLEGQQGVSESVRREGLQPIFVFRLVQKNLICVLNSNKNECIALMERCEK